MLKTVKQTNGYSYELNYGSKLYQKFCHSLLKYIPYIPSNEGYNITISHERKFIWFRVAKVGTRTIFDMFDQAQIKIDVEHPMACRYPVNLYKDYFKFAFVRNPWERIVSCWRNKVVDCNYFNFSSDKLEELQSFEKFVDYVSELEIESCDHHLRLQSKLIDLNNLDYLGRFENFEKHLNEVVELLKVDLKGGIGHKNVSTKNKSSYKDYYNEELKHKVYKIYKRDIDIFAYNFGNE